MQVKKARDGADGSTQRRRLSLVHLPTVDVLQWLLQRYFDKAGIGLIRFDTHSHGVTVAPASQSVDNQLILCSNPCCAMAGTAGSFLCDVLKYITCLLTRPFHPM